MIQHAVHPKEANLRDLRIFGGPIDGDPVTIPDETVAIQRAIENHDIIRGDPTRRYKISKGLVRTRGNFRLEDLWLYGTAAGFSNIYLSGRYGSDACYLYIHGGLSTPYTPITGVTVRNCKFESEIDDGRTIVGLHVANVLNPTIENVEVFNFPFGVAFAINTCPGGLALNCRARDFADNSSNLLTAPAGTAFAQMSGFEIDGDRVNGVGSEGFKTVDCDVRNLVPGATAIATYGDQSDGFNYQNVGTERVMFEGCFAKNVQEGFDIFGVASLIGNATEHTRFVAIKMPHAARQCLISANNLSDVGKYGIWAASGIVENLERNQIVGNRIDGVNLGAAFGAGAGAGIYLEGLIGGGVTKTVSDTLVANNQFTHLTDAGYGIAVNTTGTGNTVVDNFIEAGADVADFANIGPAHVYYRAGHRPQSAPILPPGRLTLDSAVPVTVADFTAATQIIYWPGTAPIWNGSIFENVAFTSGLVLALDGNSGHTGYHQSGKNFDLFVFLDGATPRLGTGPAWSSDVLRGTGAGTTEFEYKNGIPVNKNTITLRFGSSSGNTVSVAANKATLVGGFRTTADGQTEDTARRRFLWNMFTRKDRQLKRLDTTDSWAYSSTTIRQARADALNQVEVFRGLDEEAVELALTGAASNSTGTARAVTVMIGLDSTTGKAADATAGYSQVATTPILLRSDYKGLPGLGYHYFSWNERSEGGDTQTFFGDVGAAFLASGLLGVTRA